MLLLRRAFQKNIEMISGVWPRQESSGLEVRGKTIGLIGYGEIAQRTSVIAKSLGMKVVAFDPYINASSDLWRDTEKLSLDKLLRVSDVISLHIPLNKETNNLLDENKLSLVKPSAVLINSARGGILDENALSKALRENRIRGAALDVFSEEPLSEEKAKKFSQLNNIILTPHIAGITEESNERVSQMIADKVEKHLSDI
jgi:(S)-sulfolactate dehydrogenase